MLVRVNNATFCLYGMEEALFINWEHSGSCRLEALKEPEKECSAGVRPSVSVLQLRLLCCFAAGALMASWTWTAAAAAAWRRYAARCGALL